MSELLTPHSHLMIQNNHFFNPSNNNDMNYTQIIKVPKRVKTSFFYLDCVLSACKSAQDGISYIIDAVSPLGTVALMAYPGDYLCKRGDGSWGRISSWDTLALEELHIK